LAIYQGPNGCTCEQNDYEEASVADDNYPLILLKMVGDGDYFGNSLLYCVVHQWPMMEGGNEDMRNIGVA